VLKVAIGYLTECADNCGDGGRNHTKPTFESIKFTFNSGVPKGP
jgi:hypothetical protein